EEEEKKAAAKPVGSRASKKKGKPKRRPPPRPADPPGEGEVCSPNEGKNAAGRVPGRAGRHVTFAQRDELIALGEEPCHVASGWVRRESSSQPGSFYFVHKATGEATWDLTPESSLSQLRGELSGDEGEGGREEGEEGGEGGRVRAGLIGLTTEAADRSRRRKLQLSRRQRLEHGAAMGALDALLSATDEQRLRRALCAAEAAEVKALPALGEEIAAARARLQSLQVAEERGEGRGSMGERFPTVAVPLPELYAATGNFSLSAKVGEGGFGGVFRGAELPSVPGVVVAVKKGEEATEHPHMPASIRRMPLQSDSDLDELRHEVELLEGCSHPHLLPLIGHCLVREAPCLVFPLVRGGSLQSRLQPVGDNPIHLQRLGFSSPPPPLTWRERLDAVAQAIEALIYLHAPLLSKPCIVHRDFKPANSSPF
ncbi:MAG: hypothetical protein SGPRY_014922, partial [Prymnesium sp.]